MERKSRHSALGVGKMARILKISTTRNTWLLFLLGIALIFVISIVHTILFMKILLAAGYTHVGDLAVFEPLFVLPLVFLDYFAIWCVLWFYKYTKLFVLGIAASILAIHILVIAHALSENGVSYKLTDGIFRIVLGTLPSLLLAVFLTIVILVINLRNRKFN